MRLRGAFAAGIVVASGLLLHHPAMADDDACGLVADAPNDTAYQGQQQTAGVLVQQPVDITSADVATDDSTLYAAIRVQSLANLYSGPVVLDTYARYTTTYRFEMTAGARKVFVQAVVPSQTYWFGPWVPLRDTTTAGRVNGRSYKVTGALDMEANEVRIEAPLSVFGRNTVTPGIELGGFALTATRVYSDNGQLAPGVSSKVSVGDTAAGANGVTYVAGTLSCILPDPASDDSGDA